MSKRLQVVVDESELRLYERSAEAKGLTLSEWVRQSLRRSVRETSAGDIEVKLEAIRRAYDHAFPTCNVDEMLEQIEHGYGAHGPRFELPE